MIRRRLLSKKNFPKSSKRRNKTENFKKAGNTRRVTACFLSYVPTYLNLFCLNASLDGGVDLRNFL
jgi:hypothetical protein